MNDVKGLICPNCNNAAGRLFKELNNGVVAMGTDQSYGFTHRVGLLFIEWSSYSCIT